MGPKRKSLPRSVNPNLHVAIECWTAYGLRSTNAQIEFLLRRAVMGAWHLGKSPAESPTSHSASPKDSED